MNKNSREEEDRLVAEEMARMDADAEWELKHTNPWDSKRQVAYLSLEDKLSMDNEDYDAILTEACNVFRQKNREYEAAIHDTGVIGAATEIVGIAGRLKATVIHTGNGGKGNEKAVMNAAIDAINYGAIILMMLRRENYLGE